MLGGPAAGIAAGVITAKKNNVPLTNKKPKPKKQISKEEAFNKLRETDRASRAIVGGNRYAEFNTKNAAKRLGVSYDEYKNSKNSYTNSMTDSDRKIVKTSRAMGILFGPIAGSITYHNMSKKQNKNAEKALNKPINSKNVDKQKAVKKTEQSTKKLEQEINNKVSKVLNSKGSQSGKYFESLVSSYMKNDGKFKDRKTLDKETKKLSQEYDRLKKTMDPEEAEGYRHLFLMSTIGSYNTFNQKR